MRAVDDPVAQRANARAAIRVPETNSRLLLGGIALAAIFCWAIPATHPLFRDETGTYWIVKDGIAAVVARSYYWTNWSLYYLVEWFVVHGVGKTEFIMRLPSILSMAVAAFFIFLIGRRLWDQEAGLLAALVFAVM